MKSEKISTLPFLQTIAANYYRLIPHEYKRCCILNSQICCEVLHHFNISALLMPTQLWYVTHQHNYIVGFVGSNPPANVWDGHLICATADYIIDPSLDHLRHDFAIDLPDTVVGERFKLPSHVIARENLSDGARLWWHDAPAVLQRHPPLEDIGLVKRLAKPLIDFMEEVYAGDLAKAFSGEEAAALSAA